MADKENILPNIGGENRLPTTEELLAAIEKMPQLTEENRKELRESILSGALAREAENLAGAATEKIASSGSGEMVVLLVLISLVFLILVFFGYKLYSSLTEKERRREEKKRQKQQKKKK